MIGRAIGFFIKGCSELWLYALLLLSLLLHKTSGLPNLSIFLLLLPLTFTDIKLIDRWLFVWLFSPFALFFGFETFEALNLTLFAFSEEVFFRGYLMKKYGNITVSLLFVPPHFILYQNLPSLLTFFPSLAFGYVYIKTRSISLTAFVHFFSNILYFKLV